MTRQFVQWTAQREQLLKHIEVVTIVHFESTHAKVVLDFHAELSPLPLS